MNERLFLALGEQLKHEVFFVTNVSRPYYNPKNQHKIIDFKYKSCSYKLVLNGSINLKTDNKDVKIESYRELVQALVNSMN